MLRVETSNDGSAIRSSPGTMTLNVSTLAQSDGLCWKRLHAQNPDAIYVTTIFSPLTAEARARAGFRTAEWELSAVSRAGRDAPSGVAARPRTSRRAIHRLAEGLARGQSESRGSMLGARNRFSSTVWRCDV